MFPSFPYAHMHFLREQGVTIGLDLVGENNMDAVATAMKAKGTTGRGDVRGDVKREMKEFQLDRVWEGDPSVVEEPIAMSRISSSRSLIMVLLHRKACFI